MALNWEITEKFKRWVMHQLLKFLCSNRGQFIRINVFGIISWFALLSGIPVCLISIMGIFLSPSRGNIGFSDFIVLASPPLFSFAFRVLAEKDFRNKLEWHFSYRFIIIESILVLLIVLLS